MPAVAPAEQPSDIENSEADAFVTATVIRTMPIGAKVYLDGTYVGVTPLKQPLDPGTYILVIKKQGFVDIKDEITIKSSSEPFEYDAKMRRGFE